MMVKGGCELASEMSNPPSQTEYNSKTSDTAPHCSNTENEMVVGRSVGIFLNSRMTNASIGETTFAKNHF